MSTTRVTRDYGRALRTRMYAYVAIFANEWPKIFEPTRTRIMHAHTHARAHTHPYPVARDSTPQGTHMSARKFYKNLESVNTKEGSVNTMTENSKVLSIRLSVQDKDYAAKYLNRESVESIIRQIKRGEIVITRKGVEIERVNTEPESVNTYKEDPDGEWVRELAHDLNIDVNTFKRKIEQSVRR